MCKQIADYKNDLIQRQRNLDQMNEACREIGVQLQQLKQEASRMIKSYCNDIDQIESSSALPRSNSCPHLAGQRANSFGQRAMNELY